MKNIGAVKKQTNNRHLNLYHIDALDRNGDSFDYYFASRNPEERLKLYTKSLDPAIAVPAFVNVNDGTNEGLKYAGKNIFTVQFHPEACPGPQDSGYLFDRFINMMGGN